MHHHFEDICVITRQDEENHDQLFDDSANFFSKYLKFIKKTCQSRCLQLTNENVEYLRMAVRVKRRTPLELSRISFIYANDWLLNWLAVRSFGLDAFLQIRKETFKSDREIVKVGVEKDGNVLFNCKIPREELALDEELILKGMETCVKVFELASDKIRNNRSMVESVLKRDGRLLRYCGESLKYDKDIIGMALKQNIESCKFIPPELVDEPLVMRVVLTNGLQLESFPEYNSNRTVVITALKQNGLALKFASTELRSDEEIVKLAIGNEREALEFASLDLWSKNEFMENLLETMFRWHRIPQTISKIIEKHPNYEEFMLLRYERGSDYPYQYSQLSLDNWIRIMSKNVNLFRSFLNYYPTSRELLKDVNFLLKLSQKMGMELESQNPGFSDYLELQKAMILKEPYLLQYFESSLKSNVELMLRILRETSFSLYEVDKSLLGNREFLLEYLGKCNNWKSLSTFDDELFEFGVKRSSYSFGIYLEKYCNNKEYLIRAIKTNPTLFNILGRKLDREDRIQFETPTPITARIITDRIEKLSDEEKKDKEKIIEHLKISPMSFPFVDPSLQNDIDVVMTAVMKHGGVLKLLSPEMKKNKQVVIASKQQGFIYADKTLQRDREVILNAAKHFGGILEILDKDLRNDREIVIECIKATPMSFEFASEYLRNDPEIVRMAFNLNPNVLEFTDLVSF